MGAGCFPYPHKPLTPFASEDLSWAPFLADITTDLSFFTTNGDPRFVDNAEVWESETEDKKST